MKRARRGKAGKIRVSEEVKEYLEDQKLVRRESFDSVLRRKLGMASK